MYAESGGQVAEFKAILKKRKFQILLPAVFIFCLAMAIAVILPRKYIASGEIELRNVRLDGAGGLGATSTAQEVQNAREHLTNHERCRRVLNELAWPEYENLLRSYGHQQPPVNEYIKRQRMALSVVVTEKPKQARASVFVIVKYKNTDPERASEFIATLVTRWAEELAARDEALIAAERDELQNQVESAKRDHEEALREKSRIEREMGTVSIIDSGAIQLGGRFDPVTEELTEVRKSLSAREAELAGKEAQYEELRDKILVEPDKVVREVAGAAGDPASLRARIEGEIAALKVAQAGLKPAHSRYQFIQQEIEQKEEELRQALQNPATSIVRQETVPNEQKKNWELTASALEIEIKRLRGEVQEFSLKDAELTELQNERLRLKRELDEIMPEVKSRLYIYEEAIKDHSTKRNALTELERANKRPFEWNLDPLTNVPDKDKPDEPIPLLILAIGLAGGIAVGLGSTMLTEFTKNCYRSVSDVSAVMTIPVLGVVNEIVTRREKREARRKGAVLLASSLVVVGVISWFTWAFTQKPELLPLELVHQVEALRANFE